MISESIKLSIVLCAKNCFLALKMCFSAKNVACAKKCFSAKNVFSAKTIFSAKNVFDANFVFSAKNVFRLKMFSAKKCFSENKF